MATCLNCGKPTEYSYCSRSCYWKAMDTRVENICCECGKPYKILPSRASGSKFCSKACKDRHNFVYVTCVCGTDFRKTTQRTKYCSKSCFHTARRRRIKKTCVQCGKKFEVIAYRTSARFCTNKCSAANEETRQKMRLSYLNTLRKRVGGQIYPNWNPAACDYFDHFDREHNTHGHHARNGGERFISELGYWVDYINDELKIIMEYDEPHHRQQKPQDERRQQEIQKALPDYQFLRIQGD
jgi:hypothetical protein